MKQSLLQVALEEEAVLAAANAPPPAPEVIVPAVDLPPEEESEIEAEMAQAAGDELEMSDTFADTDLAMTNVTTLSELADILEGASEEGADPIAAEIVTIGTESIYDSMGIQSLKRSVANESFGSTMSRREATKLAMEGISDGVKKVWAVIKQAVAKLAAKLASFIKSFFDTNAKLLEKAVKLQSSVHRAGETPKNPKFSPKSTVRELTGGSTDFPTLSKGLASCVTLVKNTDKTIKGYSAYLGEVQHFKMLASDPGSFEKISSFDFTAGMAVFANGKETSVYRSEELPGNKAIFVTAPGTKLTGGEAVAAGLSKTGIRVGEYSKNARPSKEGAEYLVLSKAKMGVIISEAVQILTAIESSKDSAAKLEAAHKAMIHELDMVSVAEMGTDLDRSRIRHLQQIAVSLNRLVGSMLVVSNRIAARAAHGAVDYVEASLAQYGIE